MTNTQKNNPHRKKHTLRNGLLIVLAVVLFAGICLELYHSNRTIGTAHYTMDSEKLEGNFRIAVVSDLHGKKFKGNNEYLYRKIRDENPDVILAVGDIISRNSLKDSDMEYLSEVLQNLCEIAPVYFSLGNHERSNDRFDDIIDTVNASDATLLEKEYTELFTNAGKVRIGGLSYYRSWDEEANTFVSDFANTEEAFTLLLCHNPEFYLWGIRNYSLDLTVSGHTHGGMIRLPFRGALYAPEQGWFPEYDKGLFHMENGALAVSAGLGSSPEFIPRINNQPEILIIDVT